MRTNMKAPAVPAPRTHEGAVAVRITPIAELRRTVMACLLWEDSFYESGVAVAERIKSLVATTDPVKVAELAVTARTDMKLRHVPLFLARELARNRVNVAALLPQVIRRADELTEFLALYWKDGKVPLSASVKRGLAAAFQKFDAYALAKYNRDDAIKLRDVLFMSHAKPKDEAQAAVWKQLVDGTLPVPDTWEVELSASKDKAASWARLLADGKLGVLAFIRNLRNMQEAGIPKEYIVQYAQTVDLTWALPFRYVAAARAVPEWEDVCDGMLLRSTAQRPKLPGKTIIVVDVSGSMYGAGNISEKSDMTRVTAAGALAAIVRETCEDARLYATAGNDYTRRHATAACPPRRGMALVDLFTKRGFDSELGGGGIFLAQTLQWIKEREKTADRLIVLTDEQDCDQKLQPDKADAFGVQNYLINVASYKNGIGYGKWTHIDGWSEAVIDYIRAAERSAD